MSPRQERHIRVYGIQREKPDLQKLARALIEMARLEAEAAEGAGGDTKDGSSRSDPSNATNDR
jgi:hypothetical protein